MPLIQILAVTSRIIFVPKTYAIASFLISDIQLAEEIHNYI